MQLDTVYLAPSIAFARYLVVTYALATVAWCLLLWRYMSRGQWQPCMLVLCFAFITFVLWRLDRRSLNELKSIAYRQSRWELQLNDRRLRCESLTPVFRFSACVLLRVPVRNGVRYCWLWRDMLTPEQWGRCLLLLNVSP